MDLFNQSDPQDSAAHDSAEAFCRRAEDATKWMWTIVAPIIVVIGLFGNLMVVIIFSRLQFTKSSTLMHMFILAITDSVILSIGPVRYWVRAVTDFDLRTVSNAGCKINLFLLYVMLDFSSWILVSVTVERTLCVLKPLHVRGWFTVKRSVLRLAAIFVFLSGLNMHFLFTNGLIYTSDNGENSNGSDIVNETVSSNFSENSTLGNMFNTSRERLNNNTQYFVTDKGGGSVSVECDSLTKKIKYFEDFYFVWVDLCFNSLIPFVTMAVCNWLLIKTLRKAIRNRPRNTTRRELVRARGGHTLQEPSQACVGTLNDFLASTTHQEPSSLRQDGQDVSLVLQTTQKQPCQSENIRESSRTHNIPHTPSGAPDDTGQQSVSIGLTDKELSENTTTQGVSETEKCIVTSGTGNESETSLQSTLVPEHETTDLDGNLHESQALDAESELTIKRIDSERSSPHTSSEGLEIDAEHETTERQGGHCNTQSDALQHQETLSNGGPPHEERPRKISTSSRNSSHEEVSNDVTRRRLSQNRRISQTKRPSKYRQRRTPNQVGDRYSRMDTVNSSRNSNHHHPEMAPDSPQDSTMSSGVTRMLLLVTSVFLLTTLPSAIYYVVDSFLYDRDIDCSRRNATMDITITACNLLTYTNYGSNFLLYSARSKRFRQELKYMLGLANSKFRRHFQSSIFNGTLSVRRVFAVNGFHRNTHRERGSAVIAADDSVSEDPALAQSLTPLDETRENDATELVTARRLNSEDDVNEIMTSRHQSCESEVSKLVTSHLDRSGNDVGENAKERHNFEDGVLFEFGPVEEGEENDDDSLSYNVFHVEKGTICARENRGRLNSGFSMSSESLQEEPSTDETRHSSETMELSTLVTNLETDTQSPATKTADSAYYLVDTENVTCGGASSISDSISTADEPLFEGRETDSWASENESLNTSLPHLGRQRQRSRHKQSSLPVIENATKHHLTFKLEQSKVLHPSDTGDEFQASNYTRNISDDSVVLLSMKKHEGSPSEDNLDVSQISCSKKVFPKSTMYARNTSVSCPNCEAWRKTAESQRGGNLSTLTGRRTYEDSEHMCHRF